MYQLGSDFRMCEDKKEILSLKPVVNGKVRYVKEILKKYPQSVLMDQEVYFSCLFDPEYFQSLGSLKSRILFHEYLNSYSAALLKDNRIKMIADMGNWFTYLQYEGFNYSIGNRIHGNIMSILAGIPATVLAHDTRTREMAEFFEIPLHLVSKNETLSVRDFERLYINADYSKFNATYRSKYNAYVDFLKKYGIVSRINEKNEFFSQADKRHDFEMFTVNCEKFGELESWFKPRMPVIQAGCAVLELKNRKKRMQKE